MRASWLCGIAIVVGLTAGTLAAPLDITPRQRELAMRYCSDDATRLCPEAMADEEQVADCMAAKREQLSRQCRAVVEQGVPPK